LFVKKKRSEKMIVVAESQFPSYGGVAEGRGGSCNIQILNKPPRLFCFASLNKKSSPPQEGNRDPTIFLNNKQQ